MGELIVFPAPPPSGRRVHRPLWRHLVGHELRRERQRAQRTLADVAAEAGVSPQHLSEVERGLKEPSSEVLDAITRALGLQLLDLTIRVTRTLSVSPSSPPTGPVALAA
jgi:transcriptional regulator with XRE-family HTH domain